MQASGVECCICLPGCAGRIFGRKRSDMRMWAVQMPVVDETLKRDGVYYVKQDYIRQKYGETAWIFRTAYAFMVREMEKRVPRPEEAQSPVWIFRDRSRGFGHAGAFLYELEVPEEEMVLFDLRDWQEILSLKPLGTAAEREAILADMRRQGAGDTTDVFKSPFYPLLKKRITDSWKALLQGPLPEEVWQQGAVWRLKEDWIVRREAI